MLYFSGLKFFWASRATGSFFFLAIALRHRNGWRMAWASLTDESVPAKWRGFISGLLQEATHSDSLAAGVYRSFIPLGLAAVVFIGGLPALLTLFCAQSERAGSVASFATDRIGRPPAGHITNWKRFAYIVVLSMVNFISHGTQILPDLFAATTWISAPPTSDFTVFHDRSNLRRPGVRIFFRPPRTAARYGDSASIGDVMIPLWGVRSQTCR